MTNFIDDTVVLDFPKTDLTALPGGADATKHLTAAHWNKICQALMDIKAKILAGGVGISSAVQAELDSLADTISTTSTFLEGEIAALGGGGGVAFAGSIFSMTGPASAAAPLACWDFTKYDPALTLAQNVAAANVSGDAANDLVVVGTPGYTYAALDTMNNGVSSPFGFKPMAFSPDGGALKTGMAGTNHVKTGICPAGNLGGGGAMTVEWLGEIIAYSAGTSLYAVALASEAGAGSYPLYYGWNGISSTWNYDAYSQQLFSETSTPAGKGIIHMVVVRTGPGLVRLYVNGHAVGDWLTPAAPTAISDGKVWISRVAGDQTILHYGVRVFNVALTPAQVQASYQSTMLGLRP